MKIENIKKFHIQITYDPNVPYSILIPFILSSSSFWLYEASQKFFLFFFFIRIINTWIWFTFYSIFIVAMHFVFFLSDLCWICWMLSISLRFENFIMLKAFVEGKWHVKLMEFICYLHPTTLPPIPQLKIRHSRLERSKIKWKKRFKKRFLNFFLFSYLIPLQDEWKGSKSDVKKILSSDIFKIYLKIFPQLFLCALCVLRASCQYEEKAPFILFHSAFLFTVPSFSFWFIFIFFFIHFFFLLPFFIFYSTDFSWNGRFDWLSWYSNLSACWGITWHVRKVKYPWI